MTRQSAIDRVYSIIIAVHPLGPAAAAAATAAGESDPASRIGDINVDWVDFTREKSLERDTSPERTNSDSMSRQGGASRSANPRIPGSSSSSGFGRGATSPAHSGRRKPAPTPTSPSELSLQPLLGHLPGHSQGYTASAPHPHPLETSVASGLTAVGRGVIHLFRHAPPASLIASLDAHPVGESSKSAAAAAASASSSGAGRATRTEEANEWAGKKAEGEDGSLVAILAVPAWMRPADFLEFIGGWGTCLEGVRMIREATTPNRSIVLLKFRDPLQASDFLVIFTGRAFSSLDPRETCHPIRIHHLVLHKLDAPSPSPSHTRSAVAAVTTTTITPVPAFPPSVYSSRAAAFHSLLPDVDKDTLYELPSCPVCLERLDSSVTGLVTLPCAHTFDCDCLQKWGDSRCPVCRVSHLLLSTHAGASASASAGAGAGALGRGGGQDVTRLTRCASCDATEQNWICVVCGVVGCGRYDPGKGHARRHWEESGHVLAMELETQRVWDYKGDNYVHRLIQSRTDGKLVELPSASSLITPSHPGRTLPLGGTGTGTGTGTHGTPHTPSRTTHNAQRGDTPLGHTPSGSFDGTYNLDSHNHSHTHAGPSSGDVEKMSTIEAITLEYSYLLSSQLEAMRQHYESQSLAHTSHLSELESARAALLASTAAAAEATAARERAERKAAKAADVARGLARELESERAMASGLSTRVRALEERLEGSEVERKGRENEVRELQETVRDLMFSLEAGARIKAGGGREDAGAGGDLVVRQGQGAGGKKKGKKG